MRFLISQLVVIKQTNYTYSKLNQTYSKWKITYNESSTMIIHFLWHSLLRKKNFIFHVEI